LVLDWEVMSHPLYNLDLASSNYHLFRSLQNSLNGTTFNNDDVVKSYLVQFFASKNQKFYERGIMEQKDGKRSSIKMENISSIKFHSLYKKKSCFICMKKSAITFLSTQYNYIQNMFIYNFLLTSSNKNIFCSYIQAK